VSNLAQPLVIDAAAVDVGFFATKFTLGRRNDGAIDVDQFPSEVAPAPNGLVTMPFGKRPDGFVVEVDAAKYFVGKDVPNMVKSYGARAVSPEYSTTPSYKALFLGALAHLAGHFGASHHVEIKRLIVGLPLSTVGSHNLALKRMVEGTHQIALDDGRLPVRVHVANATVVAQPMGALFNVGLGRSKRGNTLILDMGGGTFDWFVCRGVTPNLQRCGAAPIGMLSCAAVVCERIKPNLSTDRDIMARVDEALRLSQSTVFVTGRDIELAPYLPEVDAELHKALEAMLKSVGPLDNIDFILMTGGGASLLSKVAATKLRDYQHLINMDPEPATSNVRGFHVMAEFLNGQMA